MISISVPAATALLGSLQASGIEPERGLRLTKEEGERLTLCLDIPGDNDRVIKHEGSTLLIIDNDMEKDVGDALIDIDEEGTEENTLVMHYHINKD